MTAVSPRAVLVLAGVIVLTACRQGGDVEGARRVEAGTSGAVMVEASAGVDDPYVAGDRLYGLTVSGQVTLAAAINTNLISLLSPAAVPRPGGRQLTYNAWGEHGPVVRMRDLETGTDEILEEGAVSIAWRRDGSLASFKALEPEFEAADRYAGHVVVRRALAAEPVPWTSHPGRYVVAAWARDRLIAYRIGSSWPDLLVLDGPGSERVLAHTGALIAVSPDGGQAAVATYGASPPLLRVLDIFTGSEIARLAVPEVRWLGESGAWADQLVAATAGEAIAIFRVRGDRIGLEQVLRFDRAGFTVGPFEPRLGDAGRRIVGWAELQSRPREALPQAAVLACNRVTRRCRQAPPVSTRVGVRLVYDPSRP